MDTTTILIVLGFVVLIVVGLNMEAKEKAEEQNKIRNTRKRLFEFEGRRIDYHAVITSWYAEIAVLTLDDGIYQKFCLRNGQLESQTAPPLRINYRQPEDATELLCFQCQVDFAGRQCFLEIERNSKLYNVTVVIGKIFKMYRFPDERIELSVLYSDTDDKQFLVWDFLSKDAKNNLGSRCNQIAEAIRKKEDRF